jgi:glycosylphosphatidylinositol transamidase
VAHNGYWGAGFEDGMHAFDPRLEESYKNGAKTLWAHFQYAALGRPSAAHGLLAKHRIDAVTLYAVPAEGPHGYYTFGRSIEGMLRTYNNLLERLHASFFFYLLPAPDRFMPVGHYLPAAVILGASLTLGGFDCPDPMAGAAWAVPAIAVGLMGWVAQTPWIIALAAFLPRPEGEARKSLLALAHLAYGALIPTLAMVNFPQALLLAAMSLLALNPIVTAVIPVANYRISIPLGTVVLFATLVYGFPVIRDLKDEWELFGNVAWPAFFAVVVPLCAVSWTTPSLQMVDEIKVKDE